jgi:hypothetical protein
MRLLAVLIAMVLGTASAQSLADYSKFSASLKALLGARDSKETLECKVTPIKPALNFGFRFQAGFVATIPLSQYFGPGHKWGIVIKATPEAGDKQPVYLISAVTLPDIPKTKFEAQIGGGYFVGEGRYRVEWTLFDETDRVCRKEWDVEAELSRSERKVKVTMPPNTVAELSLRGIPKAKLPETGVRPLRISILLHAAPLSLRRTRLEARDSLTLLGSLSSLMERLAPRSIRLVVFNLDQQNEIFREDNFSPGSLDRVAQAMNRLELGSVDYRILGNRKGHLQVIADLVRGELTVKEPSDAVIFMGPVSRYWEKMPEESLEAAGDETPRFFYFQFRPYFSRRIYSPDSIQSAVGRLKGKTSIIHSPGEFASSIDDLERRMSGR